MKPILNREFQHPADGWYQIEALGRHPNRAAGVVQVIDTDAAQAIVNRFNSDAAAGQLRHGHEMLVDHEHFSDQEDQESRAYGWLMEVQNRDDGIYGRIRWTATGKPAVDGGDYRFFSTEYLPGDMKVLNQGKRDGKKIIEPRVVRPLRLDGLTLTNMHNNRGQKPITNRDLTAAPADGCCPDCDCKLKPGKTGVMTCPDCHTNFATSNEAADSKQTITNKGPKMKSVCTLLGLSAEADEASVHTAVSKLLNRGDIAPDALTALRAEHKTLGEQNLTLLGEQSDALLDACGVKDEKVRNRIKDGLKLLKNREERLGYLADFGYEPGKAQAAATPTRVLNRGSAAGKTDNTGADDPQAQTQKIRNRCSELQGKGLKFQNAWDQAVREIAQN